MQELTVNNPLYREMFIDYNKRFSLCYLSIDMEDKFCLFNLIGFLVQKARVKTPDASTLPVLVKIIGDKINNYDEEFLFGLSIVVDDFIDKTTNFNIYGLKNLNEIIDRINYILERYLPFGKDLPLFPEEFGVV